MPNVYFAQLYITTTSWWTKIIINTYLRIWGLRPSVTQQIS